MNCERKIDLIMTLKNIDRPNYIQSCVRLLFFTWACVVVVLIVDTMTIVIEARLLSTSLLISGLRGHVIVPGAFTIIIMTAVHILSIILIKKEKYMAQAIVYMVGVIFICFVFARSNQGLNISLVFFIVPIFLSVVHLDKRILIFTSALTLVAYVLHMILLLENTNNNLNASLLPINIEVSFLILMIVVATSYLIIGRHDSLHDSIKLETEKKQADILTGYKNHSSFYDDLDNVFKNSKRIKGEFTLALIDIDNFILINDEFGHSVGDEVLEVIVDSINKSLVNSAQVYRYGGEEFVIICKGQVEIVINMIDSVLRDFKNKTELRIGVAVTASTGICEYDPKYFTGKRDLFAAADEALYVAKRLGKNQYAVWSEVLVRDSFTGADKSEFGDISDEMTGTDQ